MRPILLIASALAIFSSGVLISKIYYELPEVSMEIGKYPYVLIEE